ncbi:hypothetical protein BDP81DRAFT_168435 [Colletotrichum phormii]|uniref:Uncharacterized protein n=1 Tax=Colletotrichum phormii TaxID=359342 RepID=A0AAI9ZCI6_9PEZI|nr:uncharacterized protein BDP81DRAFT_168435 [Colletotrichum phormii]KAK1622009.1 hypothetical protein BDP81DRAFT_168435 [Colletotrichum phormii]
MYEIPQYSLSNSHVFEARQAKVGRCLCKCLPSLLQVARVRKELSGRSNPYLPLLSSTSCLRLPNFDSLNRSPIFIIFRTYLSSFPPPHPQPVTLLSTSLYLHHDQTADFLEKGPDFSLIDIDCSRLKKSKRNRQNRHDVR